MSFKRLDPQDFITSADSVTSPAWSGNVGTLTTFFTSSAQTSGSSGNYYLDVYNKIPSDSTAEVQFSLAYANKNGGGAVPYNSTITGSTPTSTLYGQIRTLLLEDENAEFNFGGVISDDFYIINVNRARYKEKLMPGTWNLLIDNQDNDAVVLTDNSNDVSLPEYYGTQRVYQIVSGINGSGSNTSTSGSYGLFFPDTSLFLLNAKALNLSPSDGGVDIGTITGSSAAHNEKKLFNLINTSPTAKHFQLMSEETITSNYIFVRARNSEFNYSENPSFISGSTGEVIHNSFIYNPQTYPTTVGFYNDSNELLAVAKLSKPLLKDSTKEILIRSKLDF